MIKKEKNRQIFEPSKEKYIEDYLLENVQKYKDFRMTLNSIIKIQMTYTKWIGNAVTINLTYKIAKAINLALNKSSVVYYPKTITDNLEKYQYE